MLGRLYIFVILFACTAGCMDDNAADPVSDYPVMIESLLEGTPNDEAKAGFDTLRSSGIKAFPTLLQNLDDERIASPIFQRAIVTADNELYKPRIGDVCFEIVHVQIEGNWPKNCQDFYALRPDNIREWWETNKTKPLAELRVQCARESLRLAETEFGDIDSEYEQSMIAFLRDNLKEQEQQ